MPSFCIPTWSKSQIPWCLFWMASLIPYLRVPESLICPVTSNSKFCTIKFKWTRRIHCLEIHFNTFHRYLYHNLTATYRIQPAQKHLWTDGVVGWSTNHGMAQVCCAIHCTQRPHRCVASVECALPDDLYLRSLLLFCYRASYPPATNHHQDDLSPPLPCQLHDGFSMGYYYNDIARRNVESATTTSTKGY